MAQTRLIHARYAGICRQCGKRYQIGDRIYWTKGMKRHRHETCPASGNSTAPVPESGFEFRIPFTELADKFRTAVSPGGVAKLLKRDANRSVLRKFVKHWEFNDSGFFGCTTADMLDWLARGFNAGALEGIGTVAPSKERRRIRYSEEGEFQYDLMRSGFDYPFLEWDKRESIPGMKVSIGMDFLADTNSKVVAEYERFVSRAIYALESAGVDTEIVIRTFTRDSYASAREALARFDIMVKAENEAIDWNQWSAILSPGGFRMLVFLEIILSADFHNQDVDVGLGRNAESKPWSVNFNSETRELEFTAPSSPSNFPEAEMTLKLQEALKQAKQ